MVAIATYKSKSALKKAIQGRTAKAMNEIDQKVLKTAQENTQGFYTGNPIAYKRTGQLGNSPISTGVSGGGNHLSTEVQLDDNYSYDTGTWSTPQVMSVAESGGGNLVGSPGFWNKTVGEIPDIIQSSMASVGFTRK